MERRFNLIKSDFEKHEKRVLPRFPFCYLTFKPDGTSRIYEVKDISLSGMQLALKSPETDFIEDSGLKGTIHWLGKSLQIAGVIKWTTSSRVGVEFSKRQDILSAVSNFLNLSDIVQRLKPLHKLSEGLEIPARLKYWLRSDGPVELFVWQHGHGEVAKLQVLYFETFVEWEDGSGIKTGRTLSKRNVDTPLITEDEWVFQIDRDADYDKILKAKELMQAISEELLPKETQNFLVRQLS